MTMMKASKLASAIVEQSRQRDLPILLQVVLSPTAKAYRKGNPVVKSSWYIIEEKPPAEQEADSCKGEKNEIGSRKWQQPTTTATVSSSSYLKGRVERAGALARSAFSEGGKGISTAADGIGVGDGRNQEILTRRDTIRRVSLPGARVDFVYTSGLVAFNSQLYLIGGDFDNMDTSLDLDYSSMYNSPLKLKSGVAPFQYFDLKADKRLRWQRQRRPDAGAFYLFDRINSTVHRGGDEDGWVYAVGRSIICLVHLPSGRFQALPMLPRSISDHWPTLICVAKKKIFVHTRPYCYDPESNKWEFNRVISCYDPESDKWEVVDGRFLGNWSNGVALFDDRYLFVYSNCNPVGSDDNPGGGGIYAFDVERRKWLPTPVEGLDDKGVFKEYDYLRYGPHLVHIGMHTVNDLPKLALVWQPGYAESADNTLSWSKFIIQHDQPAGCFRAQLLSKGVHTLSDYAVKVANCKALHHTFVLKSGPAKGTD